MNVRHHAVQVPATTANLGPGYDAFGLALDLHLVARTLERDEQPERVRTRGEGAEDLPTGEDNLLWRSLVAFCDASSVPVPDVAVRVSSGVPLERGLGSSSAAIVAGLTLARAVTGAAVGDRDLVTLAAEIEGHADNVAPALLGGLVACVPAAGGSEGSDGAYGSDGADGSGGSGGTDGAGGPVIVRRVNPTPRLRPVALVPPVRQRTVEARAVLPETMPRAAVAAQAARAGHVLAALVGTWPVVPALAGDLLHEPPRLEVMGASGAVLAALRGAGVHAWLSGAGPSVAAAVPVLGGPGRGGDPDAPDGAPDHLEVCSEVAREHGFEVRPLAFDLAGVLACPEDGCALSGAAGCVQCPRRRV